MSTLNLLLKLLGTGSLPKLLLFLFKVLFA